MGVRAITRLPNGEYRVNFYYWNQIGMKHRGRKKFRTMRLAETFYAERVREFETKVHVGSKERGTITVKQFLDQHYYPWAQKAKKSYPVERVFMRNTESRWGERRLSSITVFDIEKWRIEMKQKVCPATVSRRLAYLRSLFKFAHAGMTDEDGHTVGGGFIGDNPMRHVRSPKTKLSLRPPTILAPDEIARLKPDGTRGMDLVLFCIYSGMRRGEIFRMRYEDIDRVAGVIRIPVTKNDEPRIIPLTKQLAGIIDRQPVDDSGFVFSWKGRQTRDCRSAINQALWRAGITRRVRMHDLRHTFGSYLAMNGVDLDERMALMGHKTITAARIYTHYYTKRLSESMERLMEAYEAADEKTKGHKKGTEAIAV
ncbi:site-specific integrase [bacterium]|nr:site-specific integrase [bacterium]